MTEIVQVWAEPGVSNPIRGVIGPDDPGVVAGGVDMPIGSEYTTRSTGQLNKKFGPAPSDWSKMAATSGFLPLSGGNLNPAANLGVPGTLVVGADPGGAQILRVGGAATVTGDLTVGQRIALTGTVGGLGGTVRYIGVGGSASIIYHNVPTGGSHVFAVNEGSVLSLGASAAFAVTVAANAGLTATSGTFSGNISATSGSVTIASNGGYFFNGRGVIAAAADGQFVLWNNAQTDFSRLMFGGTTNLFPALRRTGGSLEVVAADGSIYTTLVTGPLTVNGNANVVGDITAYRPAAPTTGVIYLNQAQTRYLFYDGTIYQLANAGLNVGGAVSMSALTATTGTFSGDVTTSGVFAFAGRTRFVSSADGVLTLYNSASNDAPRVQFGGTTNLFPALRRTGTSLDVILADGSAYTSLVTGPLTVNGNANVVGDITAYRPAAPTTGVIYLNQAQTRYLFFDGSLYRLNGAGLDVGGAVSMGALTAAAGTFTANVQVASTATGGALGFGNGGAAFSYAISPNRFTVNAPLYGVSNLYGRDNAGFLLQGAGNALLWGHSNPEYRCAIGANDGDGLPYIHLFSYLTTTNGSLRSGATVRPARLGWTTTGDFFYQVGPQSGVADAAVSWTGLFQASPTTFYHYTHVSIAGGIRQTGADLVRFENTFNTIGAGGAGPGLEIGMNVGAALLQGYNRTAGAYVPMQLYASSVTANANITAPDFVLA